MSKSDLVNIAFKILKMEIQVYNINNEIVYHFSQFILVKVKKNLRESQAQFQEKVKKIEALAK